MASHHRTSATKIQLKIKELWSRVPRMGDSGRRDGVSKGSDKAIAAVDATMATSTTKSSRPCSQSRMANFRIGFLSVSMYNAFGSHRLGSGQPVAAFC